jgi:ABC-type amino acid transport substrate-binding protein
MQNRRYWPLALLAPLVLVLPACGRKPREPGVLRWGSDAEGGAPFVFVNPERPDEEIGFEVDLAGEIGRVLGVRTVRFQAPYENRCSTAATATSC